MFKSDDKSNGSSGLCEYKYLKILWWINFAWEQMKRMKLDSEAGNVMNHETKINGAKLPMTKCEFFKGSHWMLDWSKLLS